MTDASPIEFSKAFYYFHRHENGRDKTEGVTWREISKTSNEKYLVSAFFQSAGGEIREADIDIPNVAREFSTLQEAQENLRTFERVYLSHEYDVAKIHPRQACAPA